MNAIVEPDFAPEAMMRLDAIAVRWDEIRPERAGQGAVDPGAGGLGRAERTVRGGMVFYELRCACERNPEQHWWELHEGPDGWPRPVELSAGEVRRRVHEALSQKRNAEDKRRRERRRELDAAKNRQAHEWRQAHDPVKPVLVNLGYRNVVNDKGEIERIQKLEQQGFQTEADRRLFEGMTDHQKQAAEAIWKGFRMLAAGVLKNTISLETLQGLRTGRPGSSDGAAAPVVAYVNWWRACRREKLDPNISVGILCLAVPIATAARHRRKNHQTIKKLLLRQLDVFCQISGWPVRAKVYKLRKAGARPRRDGSLPAGYFIRGSRGQLLEIRQPGPDDVVVDWTDREPV